jgi:hypothetical protein
MRSSSCVVAAAVATVAFALGCSSSAASRPAGVSADASGGATESPDGGFSTPSDAGTSPSEQDAEGDGGPGPSSPATNCPPSWTTNAACGAGSSDAGPDFGPNVIVFTPSMTMSAIQNQLDTIYTKMDADQFDDLGYGLLFMPGQYDLDVQVGFYTHVIGLGEAPDDVTITGAVRVKADWLGNSNATQNFWRTAENLAVVPTAAIDNGTDVWATAQGTALRRVHVRGSIALYDNGGWASGGFIADSKVDTQITSGSQQQYLTRNVDLTNWQGSNWNMVFVGDGQPPTGTWPHPPYTVVTATPVVREKPFLYVDGGGNYLVMVPALKTSATGSSWGAQNPASPVPPGSPLSIDRFYIARPAVDTAATMNAALAAGKHLLLTPGGYSLEGPIQVTEPNTVVIGIGLPVLTPTNGTAAMTVADVDGVSIAGLLIQAGAASSPTLLEVGSPGSSADHSTSPTVIFDVNCRVGGYVAGTASVCFTINSNDVIIDNSWLWRADHGTGVGWTANMSNSGIVVNGDDVTAYGLFSEHHQQFQTLWNGNGGSLYFYQSEMPYDPPNQAAWMESTTEDGYASYKVSDTVTTHQAFGLGVYSFFDNPVHAANAIETPAGSGIAMHHMMTYSSSTGGIDDIINGTGGAATAYSTN